MEVSTKEVAKRLGVGPARIRAMIKSGQIKAVKIGRDFIIKEQELLRVEKLERKPGRPKKNG